jgi:mitochondrial fission process protein 1
MVTNQSKECATSSEAVKRMDGNQNDDPATAASIHAPPNISSNIFRDTPIRYLGYANEIGESFRYQYPKCVIPSYVVAFGYCLADATSTGYHTYYSNHQKRHTTTEDSNSNISDTNSSHQNEQIRIRRTIVGAMDTLLWQSLASVLIPGYVIHTIVKATKYSIPKQVQVPLFISTWLPTIMGLGAIPFIVHPIDHSVDFVLDKTVRSFYRHYL